MTLCTGNVILSVDRIHNMFRVHEQREALTVRQVLFQIGIRVARETFRILLRRSLCPSGGGPHEREKERGAQTEKQREDERPSRATPDELFRHRSMCLHAKIAKGYSLHHCGHRLGMHPYLRLIDKDIHASKIENLRPSSAHARRTTPGFPKPIRLAKWILGMVGQNEIRI